MTAAKIITAMTAVFFVSCLGISIERSPGTVGLWLISLAGFIISDFLGLVSSLILMIGKNRHAYVILAINLILLLCMRLMMP